MKLGDNIFKLRKKQGLSQEKLGEEVNVTRQTISNWELGETSPNPDQLKLLSKALKVSIDELLENEQYNIIGNGKFNIINIGAMFVGGSISWIWSFSANRFRNIEILFIVILGAILGYGVGLIINGILEKLRKE